MTYGGNRKPVTVIPKKRMIQKNVIEIGTCCSIGFEESKSLRHG